MQGSGKRYFAGLKPAGFLEAKRLVKQNLVAEEMAIGVRRFSIDGIGPDVENALIIGVIIAKQPVRRFVSKKDGLERGVWSFTVRDSPADTINVTWWGSIDGAIQYSQMFSVSDVVEITNPKIVFVHPGDGNAKFRPAVSSPFAMELQENRSEIIPHLEEDTPFIREFMHIPTKPASNYLRLSDLCGYGQAMRGQLVNLLVVLAHLGPVRTVTIRKTSTPSLCRDMVVMDQSTRDFKITIWNEEVLHWSDSWRPTETVLFLADMRIEYSSYFKAVTASIGSSTVITENPRIPDADVLRAYAKTVPVQPTAFLDHLSNSVIDDSKIDTVMTTGQLLDKAYRNDTPGGQFGALLYATVTRFDLDSLRGVIVYKCDSCGQTRDDGEKCAETKCEGKEQTALFNLRVDLTDHRGTVTNCRLAGTRAARIIGCTEDSFLMKDMEWRTERKWRLLLQRCEARVIVLCATTDRATPLISLITCTPADPRVVSAKLPIY